MFTARLPVCRQVTFLAGETWNSGANESCLVGYVAGSTFLR